MTLFPPHRRLRRWLRRRAQLRHIVADPFAPPTPASRAAEDRRLDLRERLRAVVERFRT